MGDLSRGSAAGPRHHSIRPVHGPVARRHRTAGRRRLHRRTVGRHRICRRLQAPRHGRQRRVADGDSGTLGGQDTADGLTHSERATPTSGAADHLAQLEAARQARPLQLRRPLGECGRQRRSRGHHLGCSPAPRAKRSRWRPRTDFKPAWLRRACCCRSNRSRWRWPLTGSTYLVVEQTHGSQFNKFLRAHYDLPAPVRAFNRPGPLPITAGEIHRAIADWR